MGHGAARAAFRDALEELADLEEQHDEDRFGELRLSARQEADRERAEGGDAHQEVLVQRLAFSERLGGFLERVPAHDEVGDQVDQEVLPGGPVRLLLDDDGGRQQDGGKHDLDDALPHAAFLLAVVVMVVLVLVARMAFVMLMVLVLVVMMMFVSHMFSNFNFLLQR